MDQEQWNHILTGNSEKLNFSNYLFVTNNFAKKNLHLYKQLQTNNNYTSRFKNTNQPSHYNAKCIEPKLFDQGNLV